MGRHHARPEGRKPTTTLDKLRTVLGAVLHGGSGPQDRPSVHAGVTDETVDLWLGEMREQREAEADRIEWWQYTMFLDKQTHEGWTGEYGLSYPSHPDTAAALIRVDWLNTHSIRLEERDRFTCFVRRAGGSGWSGRAFGQRG